MVVLGSPRGSFVKAKVQGGGEAVQATFPGGNPTNSETDIVTAFSAVQSELVGVQNCLNHASYAYTFGHDPNQSQFTLGITSFGTKCPNVRFQGMSGHVSTYSGSRISKAKNRPVSVTVGGRAFKGYLTSQRVSSTNAELNMINVEYTCMLLRPAQ